MEICVLSVIRTAASETENVQLINLQVRKLIVAIWALSLIYLAKTS